MRPSDSAISASRCRTGSLLRRLRGATAALALLAAAGPPVATATTPSDPAPVPLGASPARLPPPEARAPTIALVLDDLGHEVASLRRIARWPIPFTAAFLPYVPEAAERVALLRAAGKEIFLHMPMQAESAGVDPGPLALRIDQEAPAIRDRLEMALARVPGSSGVSNHMGSLFTRFASAMEPVIAWAAERGLVFLDSRTTPGSVGEALAATANLPHAARDVFLDHRDEPSAIRAQLVRVERLARRNGDAIAIGHPRPATLAALEEWIPEAQARGIRFATAGEVARRRSCEARVHIAAAAPRVSGCRSRN